MTKRQAIKIFKTQTAMAQACGVSKSAISQWPEILTARQTNEVIGAAISMKLIRCSDVQKLAQAAA